MPDYVICPDPACATRVPAGLSRCPVCRGVLPKTESATPPSRSEPAPTASRAARPPIEAKPAPVLTIGTPTWQKAILWGLVLVLVVVGGGFVVGAILDSSLGWGPWLLGLVLLVLAFGLSWVIGRMSERFTVEDRGISRRKGRRPEEFLGWEDIAAVRLQDAWGRLVLEGRPGLPTLKISNQYGKFDEFLERLRQRLDWEALILAGSPASAAIPVPTLADDFGPIGGSKTAPIVFPRKKAVAGAVFTTLLFVGLTTASWLLYDPNAPAPNNGANRRNDGRAMAMRYIGPVLALVGFVSIFNTWYRLRIEEDGLELDHVGWTKRLPWASIVSLEVSIEKVQSRNSKTYSHNLAIVTSRGKTVKLALGDRSFAFRDAILAAASRAGSPLRSRAKT